MMKKIILSTILFLFCFLSYSNKVLISGTAIDYINDEISVYGYNNHFTFSKTKLGSCVVNKNGFFKLYIDITHTQLISIPLGYYTGAMYVESNKEYVIKLPAKKSLSKKDKLNPYFNSPEILLGIENSTKKDLNYKIGLFDDEFDRFINKNNKSGKREIKKLQSEIFSQQMQELHSKENGYFANYVKYSLASLKYIYDSQAFFSIEKNCFNNKKILRFNTAYTSLYKNLYVNFLLGNFKRKNNKEITYALKAKKKFTSLDKVLAKHRQYSDPIFRELLIMTSIYDGYNRKLYTFETSLSIFSEINKLTRNVYNKKLSTELIHKITKLHSGYKAPAFTIGKTKLSDFEGKYLYINFTNTQSVSCLQDFAEMEKLYTHFGKEIEFISICYDLDIEKYNQFIANNKYNWKFVHATGDNNVYKDYDIRAFPTYCLINEKGNIIKSHARSPKEQIEVDFTNILRNITRRKYNKR